MGLDAAGVALGIGCGSKTTPKERAAVIFSFGFFQFLFALIGALVGHFIDTNFFEISNYFSGGILFLLGIYLIYEGCQNEDECIFINLNLITIIVLGMSVSIDAMGAGFSLLFRLSYLMMLRDSIIIGIIASILTAFAFKIVSYIKHIALVERFANYLGGAILITLGTIIIFA